VELGFDRERVPHARGLAGGERGRQADRGHAGRHPEQAARRVVGRERRDAVTVGVHVPEPFLGLEHRRRHPLLDVHSQHMG
jgi:hypothetical protein